MMQPLTAAPRDHLTEAQVRWLIQDSPAVETAHGCELVDQNLEVIDDISDDVDGDSASVARRSYNAVHGAARLTISRDLDWGTAIIRPYMVLTDGVISARFNLGAYYTALPRQSTGQNLPAHDVTGYDILDRLNDKTGTSYAVDAGVEVLTAVETILTDRGYTRYILDPSAAGKTLPSAYVSPLDDNKTWLNIVNDLLALVAYQGMWSDWNGYLRGEPYQRPADRTVEWVYDLDPATSIISPERTYTLDTYEAPNRWVAIRNNDIDGATPVEGNGIFTFENLTSGPTSIEARGGRTITRPVRFSAADQAALEAQAWLAIDADMRIPQTITHTTGPNPLHWHFDKITLDDPAAGGLGPWADVLATGWMLPLGGGDMDHEWQVL
ncbi:hypothetical protein [Micromonospora aurantiaca (nom. illeg.)]|uniref:hypothetical protein n=1 Tax=Micromonospora aurantiaca (nom. illeg.) TaxID=47850 RepID=UPI003F49FA42